MVQPGLTRLGTGFYRILVLAMAACSLIACQGHQSRPGQVLEPEMVLVEAGRFQMGDEIGDLWDGTRPVHEVELGYDFLIGRYPLTFDEYDQFSDDTGWHRSHDHQWGRERRPVIYVNWWDAIAYCNWLSQRTGLPPAYNQDGELLDSQGRPTRDITAVPGYRLPTEAEWEYAASGGHRMSSPRFLFSGSNEIDEVAWYSGNSGAEEWVYTGTSMNVDYSRHGGSLYEGRSTQPVGMKQPNELGIYDMSGNVWEWCHDWYGDYGTAPLRNPVGPEAGHVRVMRGGSWIFGRNDCRVACRYHRTADNRIFRIGFRIARTIID